MGDVLTKLLFGVLATVFIVIMPVILLSLTMEQSIQTNVDTLVTDFVDNARSTAVITEMDVNNLYHKIGAYGIVWDVDIKHYSTVQYPSDRGSVEVSYAYSTQEILDYLYPANGAYVGKYPLKQGDRIEVTIRNRSDFAGTKLLKAFIPAIESGTLYSHHSGVVGNYKE